MPFIDPANPSPWLASLRPRGGGAPRPRCTPGAGAPAAAGRRVARGHDPRRGGRGRGRRAGASTAARTATTSGVVALQRALGVSADGVIGPVTRRAIRNYQRNQGLAVDGIAGPATLAQPRHRLLLGAGEDADPADQPAGSSGTLARIAQCESGGDPTAVSSTGRYRGKYQFSRATWRDLGGTGDPAAAPESVQDAMAAKLLAQRGDSPLAGLRG